MRSDASWLTTTNLVLIAIGIVLAIMVILHGARLKRRRHKIDTAIEDRADDAPVSTATAALDEAPPPAPETMPVARLAPEPQPDPTPAPLPVAPAPPPLTGDDSPVVATAAPFAPAPAKIAADLATPPADPAPASSRDDLTQLKGVGPKLAARLNELGITTYAQIAALSPTEAEILDAQLGSFQGRMSRDRWVEQAGHLARDDRAGFEAAFGKL
ncbi:helix-hairpin-helix domain-containing protein [uncultured Sphingomonas sp.]|uniref:helix-hairpin-helix domain-containing protein n=1 Tax=uncultured Sphingomonas sp. TaxID=158754 RepID=UPI0025CC9BE5|nr:helix-hairpin-helix domain-containing protein [uncultured Sphingomonas sp.]